MSQMRDSARSAEWVARVVAGNPMVKILDDAGNWTGNIRTCPVRLSFFKNSLHVPAKPTGEGGQVREDATPVFEVQMMVPPCASDQVRSVLLPLLADKERESFPKNFGPDGRSFGLHSPIRDQAERQNYAGYTPGGILLRATTRYKPPIVDTANNPIVDPKRAYPGVWALVSFNLFAYGDKAKLPKKGISLGLQAVMIVADDNILGGGAVDPKTQFRGVQIDSSFDAAAAFGSAPPPPPPARRSAADLLG